MPAQQPDPNIGRVLMDGQLKLLERIGAGGMGAVYKAVQLSTQAHVAVKILHPHLAQRQDLVARFRREARAMSRLSHRNTVQVLHYGELPSGGLFIVMEYLRGQNLNQLLHEEERLPVERAVPILLQVCGALDEAHRQQIVHRDLKPENIFICERGGGLPELAKVLDFGLAKVRDREAAPGGLMLTQEGMVFGTPEFMSPEQAQGKNMDARSDLYSLAVILYELLTGKLPFEAANPMDHVALHVSRPPIPLDERVPGLQFPRGLSGVLSRALAKKPEDRFGSAREFADALRHFAPYAGAALEWVEALPEGARTQAPPKGSNYPAWVWGAVAFACVTTGALLMVLALRFFASF